MLSRIIMTTYFNNTQILTLATAGLFFLISLFFHVNNKSKLSVLFLFLTGISIFSFGALLDPFLNLWDERFHALVAKNLMHHPLMPTLYDNPIVNMDYDRWDRSIIWLHKQPLFLWQIALSFKLFGISEFTLRLPSIILSSALLLASYRVGKLLVNRRVGYLSGVLIISSMYFIELISGRQELEHNDISFLVYVSLSIWSFIEYYFSKKKYWLYLIGIFSGFAILCKWVVGLLIYFGWSILKIQQKKFKISENWDFILALFITIIVSLPWQILTFIKFPEEASNAMAFNSLHFFEVIEGHGGTIWYHFDKFNVIYGTIASFFIIPGFYFMKKNSKNIPLYFSVLSMVIIVYLFFSLADTKMPSFTISVFMLIMIALASVIDATITYLTAFLNSKIIAKLVASIIIIAIIAIRIDIESLQEKHTLWKDSNKYSRMMISNKSIFKSLNLPKNTVLFNVKGRHYVEAMFYTNHTAYNFIPSEQQYNDLKLKGARIAIFKSASGSIPQYIVNDTTTIIIDKKLDGYN